MSASWIRYANDARGDGEGPNYFRNVYPYSLPPLVEFNSEPVRMDPPDEIFITDTTFRDGQQSRSPYSVEQIVNLYTMLHRLGGPKGMIRQSEFFLYSKKDREAVERVQELGYEYPEESPAGSARARTTTQTCGRRGCGRPAS
ncbi:MAG: hypothetical protein U5Q44_16905 [Dehalococcoidia bacterium]|nr:hypothetical protein [Dehalococcoidia bacterium]